MVICFNVGVIMSDVFYGNVVVGGNRLFGFRYKDIWWYWMFFVIYLRVFLVKLDLWVGIGGCVKWYIKCVGRFVL